jgi:hypothetical protein
MRAVSNVGWLPVNANRDDGPCPSHSGDRGRRVYVATAMTVTATR